MGHPFRLFVVTLIPMPGNLKRFHTFGHDHFVTFSCYRRLPYLDDDHARSTFLDILERTRKRHNFQIYG